MSQAPKTQKSIASFFKPLNNKRKSEECSGPDPKKAILVKREISQKIESPKQERFEEIEYKKESIVGEKSDVKEEIIVGENWDGETCTRNSLQELFPGISLMHYSWIKALLPKMQKESFKRLSKFVAAKRIEGTVYPKESDVFTWAKLPISNTKVVILGQDPYHGPNQVNFTIMIA